MLDLNTVKPGQIVFPADEQAVADLSVALEISISLRTAFHVLVVVRDGTGYKGFKQKGVIVRPVSAQGANLFPFVFSAKKFVANDR